MAAATYALGLAATRITFERKDLQLQVFAKEHFPFGFSRSVPSLTPPEWDSQSFAESRWQASRVKFQGIELSDLKTIRNYEASRNACNAALMLAEGKGLCR